MKRIALVSALFLPFATTSCERTSPSEGTVLAQAPDGAEVFGQVQPFQLVERSGNPVTEASLLGQPWVATFVFSRCSGPCPRITANVARLQKELEGVDARLVTISVDPEHDTPEVLREYADKFGADPKRWWFLTGEEAQIAKLSTKSFMSALVRNPEESIGESITHTTFLAVVDAQGGIRGFYSGETAEGVEQAAARVRWLATQR